MGSEYGIEVEIRCPYFVIAKAAKGRDQYGITCEGVKGSKFNVIRFSTRSERQDYIDQHCCNYPNECPIAKALDDKYK